MVGTGSNCLPQRPNEDADCHTITDVSEFLLVISKTNNAPIVVLDLPDGSHPGLPTAPEGSTVTYTLAYHVGTLDVTNGIITDVIPVGLQYTTLSATNSDEFIFQGYNATTRTLTWRAATVTKDGTVTYKALVLKDAAKLAQPLTNTATIDSDQTVPDSDTSDVFVPTVPGGETHKPTPPPTDTLAQTAPSAPGSSLMLLLAVLGVLVVGIGFVTPVPAAVRRRNHR